MAPVFMLTTDLIISSAPPERAGAASAISETSAEFAGTLGIAFFGSTGVAVYRGVLADAFPAGLPPETVEAAKRRWVEPWPQRNDTRLRWGRELLDAAPAAFLRGLRLCERVPRDAEVRPVR
jgi:DHA2 family multidrug resistance protein-like MFS transporter